MVGREVKKNTGMQRFLFWCANDHVDFRVAEFESLARIFDIELKWVEKTACDGSEEREPWVVIDLASEEEAKKLISRSISTRYCVHLWAHTHGDREDWHAQLKAFVADNAAQVEPFFRPDVSFKVHAEAFMKKYTLQEKLAKIEEFKYLPLEGKVNLSQPDVTFAALEFYGFDHNNLPEKPLRLFFGRLVGEGRRDLITKFSLKTRLFIGNTSMDPQLSFLMANVACIREGDFMLDPFCGTGSLMLTCAQFGAFVMGSDIDFLMLHARTRPSRANQKKRRKNESMLGNFKQHNLQHRYVGVLVADNSRPPYKKDGGGPLFQAIVCDPPYGIREPTERVGTVDDKDPRYPLPDQTALVHFPKKIEYSLGDIYVDLVVFASKHLVLGGRTVFWIPVNREHYATEEINDVLPSHPCLKLVANCEQTISSHTSRRCLVYEKVKELDQVQECDIEAAKFKIHKSTEKFRENFFKGQEMSRAERKERLKKYGHLNLTSAQEETPTSQAEIQSS